ncbi:MAG: DUF881 domain-containing protein [Clostridia bacterium]|nr:DUF881 domain-containing protein [Clostridia bacterium]
MKTKMALSIILGLVSFVLVAIMFTQFKTVEQTDITAIETMREAELRTELTSWKAKYDEVQEKVDDTKNKIAEYETQLNSSQNTSDVINNEIKDYERFLGYTKVTGQGIEITLSDSEDKLIESLDLLKLVNELKSAGAEAISINDERIVTNSDIVSVNNRLILVNSRKLSSPYVVKAIGDKKYLESAIIIKGGYIDSIKAAEKAIDYVLKDDILIDSYKEEIKMDYSKEVEDND